MAGIRLTKESRYVLKAIYDIYKKRRKSGASKNEAIRFNSSANISGIEDAKDELQRAGLIECDIIGNFEIKDDAIIFMENSTKDSILKWLEFGTNFIP